jgi:transcriptional regulator with XRE-family HTH domain
MTAERSEEAQQAIDAFIAELRHWREVAGFSQKALAKIAGYDPSYVSKVEKGTLIASRAFAESADTATKAGRALVRRWREMGALVSDGDTSASHHNGPVQDDPQSAVGTALIVEHEDAMLIYSDGIFETRIRRLLRNVEPNQCRDTSFALPLTGIPAIPNVPTASTERIRSHGRKSGSLPHAAPT